MAVLTGFTTLAPSTWLEMAAAALLVADGLLFPLLLWVVDRPYATAVSRTFGHVTRKHPDTSAKDGMMFLSSEETRDPKKLKRSSICSSLPNLESSSAYSTVAGFASDTLDRRHLLPNDTLQTSTIRKDIQKLRYASTSDTNIATDAACKKGDGNNAVSNNKASTSFHADTFGPSSQYFAQDEEDHIYATLSDLYGTSSTLTDSSLMHITSKDDATSDEDDDDDDDDSVTTSANDDFEFHDRRRVSLENLKALINGSRTTLSSPSPGGSQSPSKTASLASTASAKSGNSQFSLNPRLVPDPHTGNHRLPGMGASYLPMDPIRRRQSIERMTLAPDDSTLLRKQKKASLSMNDLDLLGLGNRTPEETEEIVYLLTGRSESTMSLYRLNFSQDQTSDAAAMIPHEELPSWHRHHHLQQQQRHYHQRCQRSWSSGRPNEMPGAAAKRSYVRNTPAWRGRWQRIPPLPRCRYNHGPSSLLKPDWGTWSRVSSYGSLTSLLPYHPLPYVGPSLSNEAIPNAYTYENNQGCFPSPYFHPDGQPKYMTDVDHKRVFVSGYI